LCQQQFTCHFGQSNLPNLPTVGQSGISGGALVLPIIHDVTDVGMNTLRLEARRGANKALITKNRMRVNVTAEFYVRVKPDAASVSLAAQSLGTFR